MEQRKHLSMVKEDSNIVGISDIGDVKEEESSEESIIKQCLGLYCVTEGCTCSGSNLPREV